MKSIGRVAFFVLVGILTTCSMAFATQLGPAVPSVGHRQVNVGVGYFYRQAEMEDVDFEQNRIYLHVGYGLGIEEEPHWEVYLRGGAGDLDAGDFDADFEPFGTFGVKGAFAEGDVFSLGLVVQGTYFSKLEDDDIDLAIEDYWEVEGGIPIQAQLGPILVYAGPVFYQAKADAESSVGSTRLEEDNNVGAFGGLRICFGNVNIEGEAQYKSDFSAGGLISVPF